MFLAEVESRTQGQGHKKIRGQGQGQPFRGQYLSRPRTGMLKDQGHRFGKKQFFGKKAILVPLNHISQVFKAI